MIVQCSDGSTLALASKPFKAGAEGELFASTDNRWVVKRYLAPDRRRKETLDAIIYGKYNATRDRDPAREEYWRSTYCWPDAIVESPWLGARMPRSPHRPLVEYLTASWRQTRLSVEERGSWAGHLAIAVRTARAVRRMHMSGLCHSDVSLNNVLADPRDGSAQLIDCDGVVVPGILSAKVSGTLGCMAPEIVAGTAEPSVQADLHALAVVIYQTLLFAHPLVGRAYYDADPDVDDSLRFGERALYREHPRDRSNAPRDILRFRSVRMLGAQVERLAARAFVDALHDPARRPSAAEWEQALARLEDRCVPCLNQACEMKGFVLVDTSLRCPWCGHQAARSQANFVELPMLRLYRPLRGRLGEFSEDGYAVVGWPGRALDICHADPQSAPGPGVTRTPLARLEYAKGQWLLCNIGFGELQVQRPSTSRQRIGLGESVALCNDMQLFFGPLDSWRMALVHMAALTNHRQ